MNRTQRRPPLGDIYCPPNQVLSEENEYLYRVGLVVLIRGSPSPALPRLITDKLIAEHGGRQTDYIVSQATIAPYVINCSSTRLRDAIVQRGIYSISQAAVQFTIHEWRPRFGMGYDPSTHQVWVRITGLPLQAWTAAQITAIIRKFGHPIQILPYGQAAGHYKDITALVATKSPALIPLAYTYREGTYASRIDISILSWRLWEEGYFPPPEDHSTHDDDFSPTRTYENPMLPQCQPSPSESLAGGISEPTIDLSAWSPRSYQLTLPFLQINKRLPPSRLIAMAPQPSPLSVCSKVSSREFEHTKKHLPAASDPTSLADIPRLFSLIHATLLTIPNPIVVNGLSFLQSIDYHADTKGIISSYLSVQLSLLTPSLQHKKGAQERDALGETPNLLSLNPNPACIKQLESPFWPNGNLSAALPLTAAQTQYQTSNSALPFLPAHPHLATLGNLITVEPHMGSSPEQNADSYLNQIDVLTQPSVPGKSLVTASALPTVTDTSLSPLSSTPMARKKKETNLPTRRSKRLQAQQKAACLPEATVKSRSHTCQLPFLTDSHMTALDPSQTMEILQETGLLITKEMEDMIEEAIQTTEHATPGTPLHDLIPPLPIPGTNSFL